MLGKGLRKKKEKKERGQCIGAASGFQTGEFLPEDGRVGSPQRAPSSEKNALVPRSFYLALPLLFL